jgi:DNA-directed RNA polymerase specialized sigma24 family protein/ribosome-associated translation inhibitor RaiA
MNLHFSFKSAKTPDIEREIQLHVRKLERHLQVFRPQLVHLHGAMANGRREGVTASLNLRLPTGQLFAAHDGDTGTAALKMAFADLLQQLKKHKDLLRHDHRSRLRRTAEPVGQMGEELDSALVSTSDRGIHNGEASREEITVATFAEANRNLFQADVRGFIDANLERLERFIERELRFRENSGSLTPGFITRDEVLDEVVLRALSLDEQQQNIPLERWLYKLAIHTIQQLGSGEDQTALRLEEPVGRQNVSGTDDALLQFHQPGETLHEEDIIADIRAGNPEELAANDEFIDQLESALRSAKGSDREAFVLFAIEGFSMNEISQITERDTKEIKLAIGRAREHLMKKLPSSNSLKQKLLKRTHVA